jgi:serine protease Do
LAVVAAGVALSGLDRFSHSAYAAEKDQAAAAREQLKHAADLSKAFQHTSQAVRPSVVTIISVKRIRPVLRQQRGVNPLFRNYPLPEFFGEDFFDRFFGHRTPEHGFEQRGLGTGVIVTKDGYILTNNHVVGDADEVTVKLSDSRDYQASVVGTDEKTDLAVLKIDAEDLVPAVFGDSDELEVGEWVLAVGNPFGLGHTVTAGIVSAKGRANVGIADYEDFIQTDAAINPGNSGGPLLNLSAEVVGINTAIATRTGTYMGIGFAIPSNMARSIMKSILEKGRVDRGWLGVVIQDLNDDLSQSFGYESTNGVLVSDVMPDGPAAKAGLRAGDIVTEYDGKPMGDMNQFRNAVAATTPGRKVDIRVFRGKGYKTLAVQVGQLEGQTRLAWGADPSGELGLTVQTVTPEIARQLGYGDVHGVVVTGVEPGSPADKAGIRPRDVITDVADDPIENIADFRAAMSKQDLKKGVRMRLNTGGARRFAFVKE